MFRSSSILALSRRGVGHSWINRPAFSEVDAA
jgi:hypothetical protein